MRLLSRHKTARRRSHDPLMSLIDLEWTVLEMFVLVRRSADHEPAIETFTAAELLFADLMADRARDAILRLTALLLIGIEWKEREHLPVPAVQLREIAWNRH